MIQFYQAYDFKEFVQFHKKTPRRIFIKLIAYVLKNKLIPPSVGNRNDIEKLKSKPLRKDRKTKYLQDKKADT